MHNPHTITRTAPLTARFLPAVFLAAFAACGGCGGSSKPEMKEGSVEELMASSNATDGVPLDSTALMVEEIKTTLGPQKDEYRIGPNDVLNIIVIGHEEVSSARDFNRGIVGTVVKKDGHIYLPIVGPVKAAGYTVEEFHQVLGDALKTYIVNPQLTIDVLQYASQKFYVLGEVNQPGSYPVDGDTTLLEAIGLAQGVKPEGSLDRAYMVRGKALLPINFTNLLMRGDISRNVYMQHGDLVYIPSAQDHKVYVFGEVNDPKAVQIPHGRLSLAQALAEAGGIVEVDADKNQIKLIRGSWQEPTVFTLKYSTILAYGDAILLRPGDRVVVQPTGLTVASRYMEQIMPFLVAADIGSSMFFRWRLLR